VGRVEKKASAGLIPAHQVPELRSFAQAGKLYLMQRLNHHLTKARTIVQCHSQMHRSPAQAKKRIGNCHPMSVNSLV
jgi:hypothetical protein